MKLPTTRSALAAPSIIAALAGAGSARATSLGSHAARAQELTVGLDLDDARKELLLGNPDDPNIIIESGRLALYEANCDLALVLLSRPEIARTDEGSSLADIARGCSRVTAATILEKDDARSVEIRYQDEADRALTPFIAETVELARQSLTRDLGATWPKPTRITVVRDLASLSAMTGLPRKDAETTGTVAVAKWGRVTLLSPRASTHGYSWRDTLAHELTHLAVTRATIDRAPLWLQEGVAKREEVRWRTPGPFDGRPSPDAVVQRGIELKLDLPLDRLGPSIAMLPSADAALVAFAEVTSFVAYLASEGPANSLPKLLLAIRGGASIDDALKTATGATLKEWDTKWRAHLAELPRTTLSHGFGLGESRPGERELGRKARLAELLLGRGHAAEALAELDKAPAGLAKDDASLAYLRARILEALGRGEEGAAILSDPRTVAASFGPWWAVRGRLARAKSDDAVADPAFVEAVAVDPLDVEPACEGIEATSAPKDPLGRPLCDAARARHEPDIGKD